MTSAAHDRAGEGNDEQLVIFTRYPEPGRTKTRLVPVLGPYGAAGLQRRMTAQTVATAAQLSQHRSLSIAVCFDGGSAELMAQWLGPTLEYRPQGAGDLGRRMRCAFEEGLRAGSERVVIVGSDCPALTADHLRRAYVVLEERDIVLGPARDGGYYLIGARGAVPEVFGGIPWGTGRVLESTLSAATRAGLRVGLLEELPDVDVPEDLAVTPLSACLSRASRPQISVVIPVLDEALCIQETLASASRAENVELIVVDGGSADATARLAQQCGACVLRAPACRSVQMNLGAAAAGGEVLLFLHGDTRLPDGYDTMVRKELAQRGIAAGAFRLGLNDGSSSLRLVERMVNWRARYCQTPYGDQAIFLRADLFRRLGGFRHMAIMEDYELVRRLMRWGRIVLAEGTVVTSARRWRRLGVLRTTLINYALVAAYELGVPADRLARWYRRD